MYKVSEGQYSDYELSNSDIVLSEYNLIGQFLTPVAYAKYWYSIVLKVTTATVIEWHETTSWDRIAIDLLDDGDCFSVKDEDGVVFYYAPKG